MNAGKVRRLLLATAVVAAASAAIIVVTVVVVVVVAAAAIDYVRQCKFYFKLKKFRSLSTDGK